MVQHCYVDQPHFSLCDEGEKCLWIRGRRISDNIIPTNTFAASVRMHSAVSSSAVVAALE